MNNEIKEILDMFTKYKDDWYSCEYKLKPKQCVAVLDYITNLQKENEHLRTQVNTYENPDDYTLFYMWLDAKAKDKMKQLQEENERLKEKENKLQEKFSDWKKEIEKERKHYLCDRTDCCGRIKDSKKYRSLYQENERLNNIINELEKYLKEIMESYGYENDITDRIEKIVVKNILNKLKKLKEGK